MATQKYKGIEESVFLNDADGFYCELHNCKCLLNTSQLRRNAITQQEQLLCQSTNLFLVSKFVTLLTLAITSHTRPSKFQWISKCHPKSTQSFRQFRQREGAFSTKKFPELQFFLEPVSRNFPRVSQTLQVQYELYFHSEPVILLWEGRRTQLQQTLLGFKKSEMQNSIHVQSTLFNSP